MRYLVPLALVFCACVVQAQAPAPAVGFSEWNVATFGAVGDGTTDNTAAFQAALDAAGAAKGGTVRVPTGNYAFNGVLNVPAGVALQGTYVAVPSHSGLRDAGEQKPEYGSVLLAKAGAGSETGPGFITLNTNSVLAGVCIYYPDQKPEGPIPTAYPYAVVMRGNNPALINSELLNPYNAIDASYNQRALIRNVHGQPLHIGIYVNEIYDIGRIENVHWNPWWSMQPELLKWQMENGIGFIFEKTDWHYVLNTFCFGYNIGYKFSEGKNGACNGNFLGIGADDCYTAVLIEQSAPMGILITNGEFVSFKGPDPTMVRVSPKNTGTVRFNNSAFWGPCNRIAVVEGSGTIGFSDCTFVNWSHHDLKVPALDLIAGTVLVRGNEFKENKAQIRLGEGIKRAVITDNVWLGDERIENAATGNVAIANNVGGER